MPRNQSNRGGSRRGNNNNPEGRNQYNSGLFGMVRDRPATTAAVAAGAVATGVFLWSKRAQISDQLSQLSDQVGEWTDSVRSSDFARGLLETVDASGSGKSSATRRGRATTSGQGSDAGNGSSSNASNSGSPTA